MDLLGDIGGIAEVLELFFCFILWGYSDFSFIIKALEKVFIARSKETGIIPRKLQRPKKSNEKKLRFPMFKYPPPSDIPARIIDQFYSIKFT